MPTRLVHLVADADDPARLARFWAAALDWEIADETTDEIDVWPAGYHYPDPSAVPLVFVPVPEPKSGKNRVHLDLATTSLEHQAALVRRVRDLGARPLDIGQGEAPWWCWPTRKATSSACWNRGRSTRAPARWPPS